MEKRRFLNAYNIFFALTVIFIGLYSYKIYTKNTSPINEYIPKVLVIYKSGTENYFDVYQNFKQSYILNTEVTAADDADILDEDISRFDIVYPDVSIGTSVYAKNISQKLVNYVANGGNLFIENDLQSLFSKDFTGIKEYVPHTGSIAFSYPDVPYNAKQLQLVLKSFLDNFYEYRSEDLNSLHFNKGISSSATSLANLGNGSLISLNKYNKGYVLSASNLLPNTSKITGFDLTAKNKDQQYFDYSFATINYLVRNEFLAFALKEKTGYVLKKVFGPYGRPAMAWQNHYEALTPIKNREAVEWIDILKEYNQIPSYSLVRGAFDWGVWKANIAVHYNTGSNSSPSFQGENENSFYSSGQTLMNNNDYITFGDYPEYKSWGDKIELPYRASPAVADVNGDGVKDLIVGAPDGKLYTVKISEANKKISFGPKEELQGAFVDSYASPAIFDINGDGLFDIVVGNKEGSLTEFINEGTIQTPKFKQGILLKDSLGRIIKTGGYSTPVIGNINNDGITDMLIGSSSGTIYSYYFKNGKIFYLGKIADKNIDVFSSPAIYDWNNDGLNDILVGDNSGYIKILINKGKTFEYYGEVEGKNYNHAGTKSLLGGHNSVPLVYDINHDGANDLVVGQLAFGLPYDIGSESFKYRKELKDTIAYAQSHGIEFYPHMLTHEYKTSEQELKELELQKKSFEAYGLKWPQGGVDQHTWHVSSFSPQQTLQSELSSGIWWNFGLNFVENPDLPRDGKQYLWSVPFLLSNKKENFYFLTFTPGPNLFMYPKAYDSFAELDMPVTYFEHIEYMHQRPGKLDSLKQMAAFLNTVREKGEYNFMTQPQMARSFINTFYSKAAVSTVNNVLKLTPDTNLVPNYAEDYKGTLGLKFEKGEKYKDIPISTNSDIHYENNGDLYFALSKPLSILFNTPYSDGLHIVKSNVPIEIKHTTKELKIRFLITGMQQVKLYSKEKLDIQGERIKIEHSGDYYTVTHYGYPITIKAVVK